MRVWQKNPMAFISQGQFLHEANAPRPTAKQAPRPRRPRLSFQWARQWAREGTPGREMELARSGCGPQRSGVFNEWVAGSFSKPTENRNVKANRLEPASRGCTSFTRAGQLRALGLASCTSDYTYMRPVQFRLNAE